MRAVAAVAKSAFMVIGVLLGYFLRRKSASSAGLGLAWAFAELPCGWRSADFLTGRMAKGLTGVAVSGGKAGFYVGTLFAYELVRLGFRLLMEAVSGPRVAIRSAPWGRAGHTEG